MVNMQTAVATENIAFSSSRTVALLERENVAKLRIFYKTPSLYIEQNKNPSFYIVRWPCLSRYTARIRDNTQSRTF